MTSRSFATGVCVDRLREESPAAARAWAPAHLAVFVVYMTGTPYSLLYFSTSSRDRAAAGRPARARAGEPRRLVVAKHTCDLQLHVADLARVLKSCILVFAECMARPAAPRTWRGC